jgi:hypothetical protein
MYIWLHSCYCMFMYLYRASWHSSATLTEGFPCFFLICKANVRVLTRKDGALPALFQNFCVVLYTVLCHSMYCLCVNVYCTTAKGWLSNCSSYIISLTFQKHRVGNNGQDIDHLITAPYFSKFVSVTNTRN